MNKKAKTILRPLFLWTFLEALIFWYAIEKLLWDSMGITAGQIIVLGIIAQSSQILIEVPSSVIADRWSRRKTLMLSTVCMLVSVLIVLMAQTFIAFAVMCLTWAFYYAFQSGTVNAYIYDLLKEQGEQAQYRKALARRSTFQLSALLVSSLLSSVFVEWGNLLTPYWVTLIPSTIALVLLWRMHDPGFERTHQSMGTPLHHVRSAIRNVTAKRWLSIIFLAIAFVIAGRFIWYEYYQLYAIEREVAALLFGLMLALIHIGSIMGAELAHRVKDPNDVLVVAFACTLLSTAGLIVATGSAAIICLLVLCFFGSEACSIVFDESLQHQTDSELRATTLSLVGLASRVIFGILALGLVIFETSPGAIALAALIAFIAALIYIPVRKRLVSAELTHA